VSGWDRKALISGTVVVKNNVKLRWTFVTVLGVVFGLL
jgi:hypothetical protein